MSSNVPGMERHAKTLRAWQLAILRFVVTLDNADRLAVLMIAAELDGVGPKPDNKSEFSFFRKTSAELCAAILRGSMMTVSGVSSPQQWKPTSQRHPPSANLSSAITVCGRDFLREAPTSSSWHGWRRELRTRCGSRAAGGCAIEEVLLPPFRSGTAHIVIFGPVFPGRPVP
jgi:hypothetical protein